MLTIHLGQDENDCFSAWVSAKETGLAENDAVDQKGKHLFSILLATLLLRFSIFFFCFSELWKPVVTSIARTLVEATARR